jgi:hypothetical protein
MRLANIPPERIECFVLAMKGASSCYFKNLISTSPYYCPIARFSQNLTGGTGYSYMGACNYKANDFPVFCADNYPVDPNILNRVSGFCKECSILLLLRAADNSSFVIDYSPSQLKFTEYSALCEDL